jgi:hypothetical protein
MNVNLAKEQAEIMGNYSGNMQNSLGEYLKLKEELKNEKGIINLVVGENEIQHRKALTYFLREHKISSDWTKDDGYISPYFLDQNKKLQITDNSITYIYNPMSKNKIANMEKSSVFVSMGNGFYNLEHDETNKWHWSQKNSVMIINNYSLLNKKINFQFSVRLPSQESGVLELWYENEKISEFELKENKMFSLTLDIKPNESLYSWKFMGESVKLSQDPRDLAFMIRNLQFQIIE